MKVDVLICTAIGEELTAIQDFFQIEKEICSEKAPLIYRVGSITSDLDQRQISYAITCFHAMGNTNSGINTFSSD